MGLLVGLLVWGVCAMTVFYVIHGLGLMLPAVSEAGTRIDSQFMVTLIVTGVAFILAQLALGYFIWRYRDRGQGRALYLHGNKQVEIAGVIVTGVTFVGMAVFGQGVWASVHLRESPPDALHIEVTAEQFLWNMRYPGPDGVFGRTSPKNYQTSGNTVGIVPDDPAGKDDFIVQNQLVVPLNRPIELTLRSKDVIHSFFVPALRLKQDTVPGLAVPLRFSANRLGEYEIACAEVCGLAHYRMRGTFKVMEAAAYDAWLKEQQPALN